MHDAIKSFPEQFLFSPVVENADKLRPADGFIVAGMGGSHLAADLLRVWKPDMDIVVQSDYGFPADLKPEWLTRMLFIASSYSGNTEETLDSLQEALKRGMPVAAVAAGGKLLDMARDAHIPYVVLPNPGIQPRSSIGFGIKALLALTGEREALAGIGALAERLKNRMDECEKEGKALAEQMRGFVPVIYASDRNRAVAYNWKIKFNETGKIPAFYNVFPELNHNEMTGFDRVDATSSLSAGMYLVFLEDAADHPKIQKRMAITKELYGARAIKTASVKMTGGDVFEKIFSSTLTADWTAYHTARIYGTEADQVPMVEEFKKRIAA